MFISLESPDRFGSRSGQAKPAHEFIFTVVALIEGITNADCQFCHVGACW
jgi:hypothetical protein